jgi:DNA repair exonuclease SbcCD ATPase subunit
MEADIAQQNRKQASIRQETYILKKNANELKDQIANLSISLRELQATERQLSKEVVDSPDRIKFELETAHSKLDKVKQSIEQTETERKVIQLKISHVMTAEGDTRRVMHLMDEMEVKVQEYEVVEEDLEDIQRRLEGAEHRLEERTKEKEVQEKKLQVVGKSLLHHSLILIKHCCFFHYTLHCVCILTSICVCCTFVANDAIHSEKRKVETSKMLTKTLHQTQNEVQHATHKLDEVEKDRSDGFERIEKSQRRVQELETCLEKERKRAMDVVNRRIASFQKFDKAYWEREQDTLDKILCA